MKAEKYYVGFDIGTDSVGYAVTDEQYNLCKLKGKPMWGVNLFDEAQTAVARRGFRTARRRLDRRQQRVRLLMELFALEIGKTDEKFFTRIKESYLFPETEDDKVRLFGSYEDQKKYNDKYPTIHHLIVDLMESRQYHDARLVYIACAWLVAHRGHFLSEVDKNNIEGVTDFKTVYKQLVDFIQRDGEYSVPWKEDINLADVENALKKRLGVTNKTKAVSEALFGANKPPKAINEKYEYNYELVIKLLCGGKVALKDLFGKEEYSELDEKAIALNMDEEKLTAIMQSIGDDSALISVLKSVYDWSVLIESLDGKHTISEAKVAVYYKHQSDLKTLKRFVKKYLPNKYDEVFRLSDKTKDNYVAYIGKTNTKNEFKKSDKSVNREDFCTYILGLFKAEEPDEEDKPEYGKMISRLELKDFMPKQVDGDNRVIPYQLYWHELNRILENAQTYLPFLNDADADGYTVAQKILSVFEFRVPYFVGPLGGEDKYKHWMKRKDNAEGIIIRPWNFDEVVDLDKSEEAFITRMTNFCTYLPGEDVLPKNSLVYSAFEVLNEINNIKINGNEIPVSVKQGIYNDVFNKPQKVTRKRIEGYLVSCGYMTESDIMSGLDITVKSSLKPFLNFKNLIGSGKLDNKAVERIITRAAYSEDKARFISWLKREYPALPEDDIGYISKLKLKNFGRLSRRLLCEIPGADNTTGEYYPSIIRAMWETNRNFMQLLSDRYTFGDSIKKIAEDYYQNEKKSIAERLDEMYVSNPVKRPIIRTLDILSDIVKIQGHAPERIFIEMARGANEDQKGKRTQSRLMQIRELYKKVKDEDVRQLSAWLDEQGEAANNKLQGDKLFLYFMQFGKCLYTGEQISLESVLSGDGTYNIEHIYPRSFVKDDSVINNLILVNSKANGDKSDTYPISSVIRQNMRGEWERLKKNGAISDEKFKRLTRTTGFTDEEKFEFVNRQLVETRQSTKAVKDLLHEHYRDSTIVCVKAGLVSEFRNQFNLPKSRSVNDLHHAKDAYLNIAAGNVWHSKFSAGFWRKDAANNAKVEVVFTRPVMCGNKTVWRGAADKDHVAEIARKNTACITMYSYFKHSGQNGGFFDQNPLRAGGNLIPRKKDMPTEIYGGYNSATVSGFILAKYRSGKKQEISFVPLKLLYMDRFIADKDFAREYVFRELGEGATDIEILLDSRLLKIYSVISLDGALYCIRGLASSTQVGLMNLMPFMTSTDNELYIKKLERYYERRKKNEKLVYDAGYDFITPEGNIKLYDLYIQKLSSWPYSTRPGIDALTKKLRQRSEDFAKLGIDEQANTLLQIQGLFGRIKQADLRELGESPNAGIAALSLNLSNWKKRYKDVRIVDRSASGLFESSSCNLLELL